MILISHRGNIAGPIPELENDLPYIIKAIDRGYLVEVDLWVETRDSLWFGHDKPQYHVSESFLKEHKKNLIIHAKTLASFYWLSVQDDFHYFYHESSPVTITSKGWLWCAPRNEVQFNSIICVDDPYIFNYDLSVRGIYSDYIDIIKRKLE